MYKLPGAIERWRRASGKTQGQLADELELRQQTVSDWERGTTTPTVENIARLGAVLGVSAEELGATLLDDAAEPSSVEERLRRLEALIPPDPQEPETTT